MTRPFRRTSRLLLAAAVLALLLGACAPGAPATTPNAAESGATESGGLLTIGLATEPVSLDPIRGLYIAERFVLMQIFDTLLTMAPDGSLQPGLATEWQQSEDGTTFTFTLRDDVTFHDGTALDAAAVKAAIERVAEVTDFSSAQAILADLVSVEAGDGSSVTVTFGAPKPRFLEDLTQPWMGIPAPTATDLATAPVGSGPFRFAEWIPQESLRLERNPDYAWAPTFSTNPGAPLLEGVVFRFLPEQSSRLSALQVGEAQVVEDPPAREAAPFIADGSFVVKQFTAPGMPSHMMLNVEKAPTDDINVRKAIILAVNQAELAQVAFGGLQSAASNVLSPSTFGYSAEAAALFTHDLAQAQALLADAGWADSDGDGILEKDGEALTLVYPAIPAYESAFMELVAGYLRTAGFDVQIQTLDDAGVFEMANRGDHNMVNMGWTSSDPGVLNIVYNSANIEGGSAFTRFRSEELDGLLNQAASELDLETRRGLYEQAQMVIMENALALPVHNYDRAMLMSPAVQGWRFDAEGYPLLAEVSLAQ